MERITAMNNRIQLLMVLKYIMEKYAESEPVSNADILSYLASKNIKLDTNKLLFLKISVE